MNDFGITLPSAKKCGDVVYAQIWEVLTLKKRIEPPQSV